MPWQTPKTNWTSTDGVADADLNRIEENVRVVREQTTLPVTVETRTTDPASPAVGRVWLRTDL